MKFSIVLIVKNDFGIAKSLDRLQIILKDKQNCEVLVIDASLPKTLEKIKQKHPWVKWIYYQNKTNKNITIPEQRNLGISKSTGEVIIFLDANCIPVYEWFSIIEKAFVKEKLMVVTGPVTSIGKKTVHDEYYEHFKDGQEMSECGGANLSIRKDLLKKVNGFDEEFSYGEDVDLIWRIQDAGYSVIFKKDASISHNWGEFKEELRRAFRYGTTRTNLYKKHTNRLGNIFRQDIIMVIYPTFLIFLPITFYIPFYPLFLLIPILKNLNNHPFQTIVFNLIHGAGVINGLFRKI